MVKYSRDPENPVKTAKARASDLRVHFKNTRETAMALKNMDLGKAKAYLQKVLDRKDCIPLRRFGKSAGRSNMAKNHKHHGTGRWPVKSVKHILDLITNAESNAEVKSLEKDNLVISHVQVNQAQRGRRRTYRAHGRINAYMSSPCHVEIFLTEKEESVKKPEDDGAGKMVLKFSRKRQAQNRLKAGATA